MVLKNKRDLKQMLVNFYFTGYRLTATSTVDDKELSQLKSRDLTLD